VPALAQRRLMVASMADQRGRCSNTDYCSDAVKQRVFILPGAESFTCPRCGGPLQTVSAARRRNRTALFLQAAVVFLSMATLSYALISQAGPLWASAGTMLPGRAQAALRTVPPADGGSARTVLLRIAGSDVIGARLAPRLAANYLGLIGSTDIATSPGSAEGMIEVAGQRDAVTITLNSAAAGFSMLLRRTADVAMSATRISGAEAERLQALGDMTSPAAEAVIAVQGIVVAVSPANPAVSLTLPQLRDIFSGRTTDWAELGGAAGPVHVYVAQGRGSAAIAPQEIGIGQDGITATANWVTGGVMAAALAADRGGIGLLPFGGTGPAKVLALGDGTSPVIPNRLTISAESYPLVRRLYLYAAPNAGSPLARRFTDYVFTPAGQAAVEAAGFMPLATRTGAALAPVPEAVPDRLRQVLAGATRMSMEFRLQPGTSALDSRSARDLDRLASQLRAQHISSNRLILAGFTDNSGVPQASRAMAQAWAEAVAAALTRGGIAPGRIVSFGSDMPVADNATPDGRERNRRVEVYLAPP